MTRLVELMQRIDDGRDALLARLQGLDPEALRWRAAEDRWSALDVVEHLVVSDGLAADRVEDLAGGKGKGPGKRTLAHRLKYGIVMFVLRNRWIRVKTPSPVFNPSGLHTLEELAIRWRGHHRTLRAFAEAADPADAHRPVMSHPVAGPMTALQSFDMLATHLRRHTAQVDEILAARASRGA